MASLTSSTQAWLWQTTIVKRYQSNALRSETTDFETFEDGGRVLAKVEKILLSDTLVSAHF